MRPEVNVKVKVTKTGMHHSAIPRGINTPNLGFLHQIIKEICARHYYSRNKVIGQDLSDLKMVCDTSASKDVSIQQIWDSHLKIYMRYVLDTIILQTRSEVKVKVIQKWYVTFRHQKLHPLTKFGIPTFNNIGDMLLTRFF